MTALVLKVKTKSGQQVIKTLTAESTIKELKVLLSSVTEVPENKLHVLAGFPPRNLVLSNESLVLSACGITTGDTLIVDEKEAPAEAVSVVTETTVDVPAESTIGTGILLKKVVPSDNSCLFTSIHFVLNGRLDDSATVAPWMRELIAQTVSGDLETYSEAFLGKTNAEYCKWIKDDKSWGGAIEISILSNYYGMEIAVVDTINAIINRFGEDQDYGQRVFLLFDGIHYDPLYLEPFDGSKIQTIFPRENTEIIEQAEQLALEANSSRQFTDVNKFKLKCMVCDTLLSGEVQAQQHAKSTGHTNFGEI